MTRAAAVLRGLLPTVFAIVLALVVGAVLILFSEGWDFAAIGDSYWNLVKGSIGSLDAIGTTLERAAPLICAGLGVTLAFRAGLFNIGAQGQLILGSIGAGYVGFHWNLPPVLHLVMALIAALLLGGAWGGIVGFLKARTGAHEVITTIMFNYLAVSLLMYVLKLGPFKRPNSDNLQSPIVDHSARFPDILGFHSGVWLAFLAAIGVWWLLERSTIGFEMRAVGANANASRTAGMSPEKVATLTMIVAGALAGLGGAMNILGHGDSLSTGTGGSIGFDAITVALLGRGKPLGTVLAGLLFGALSVGGVAMQANAGTPKELVDVLQAVIVLFVAAPALVRSIVRFKVAGGGSSVLAKGWGG